MQIEEEIEHLTKKLINVAEECATWVTEEDKKYIYQGEIKHIKQRLAKLREGLVLCK